MADLERELRELVVDWPATPDLAGAVRARVAVPAAPARARRRAAWRPALAWALAIVLLVLGGALAVSPDARSAVLELLGLRGVRIERREPAPSPGAGLGLGERVSLSRARAQVGFDVLVPAALGAPDAVHLASTAPGGPRVALLYAPRRGLPRAAATRAGLLVQQLEARFPGPLIEKSAGAAARVQRLTIDGAPAVLIEGAHGFLFEPSHGDVVYEEQRLAGTTLLLERDGILVRLEGDVPGTRLVAIARSLR